MIYLVVNSEETILGAFKKESEAIKFMEYLDERNPDSMYSIDFADFYSSSEDAIEDYES